MNRGKKALDVVFALCFVAMIFIPFLMLDTRDEINSQLENRAMTRWPGLHFDKLHTEWYGHYVEDRVGFREEAIMINADLNYKLFGEFSEELHMFGKEGYIFPADEGYVQNYQRTNIDEELMDNLVTYASRTNAYAKEKGATFVLMICPNKSSVYRDYMPDSIHVDERVESTLDMAKSKMQAAGVPYVIPHEEFCILAETEQIYNMKYDCAHWNDLGAFYGLSMADEVIRESYPDIPVMEKEDFAESKEVVDSLEFFATSEPMTDTLPKLTVSVADMNVVTGSADVVTQPGNAMAYYYNENAYSDKTILILHDSFMDYRESWYTYRYREVYYTSRVNYTHMKTYIDTIQPDVILFEVAERAFADDLHAYTELGTIVYE